MNHTRISGAILMAGSLAISAACGPARTPAASSAAPAPTAAQSIEDRNWRLVELGGQPVTVASPERAPHLRLVSESKRVQGSGGCNRMNGTYTLQGDRLSFGPILSTKMACIEADATARETAFFEALANTARYRVEGSSLLLSGADRLLARLEIQPE
jgi:copper homeostasis protein (lipoprotein)